MSELYSSVRGHHFEYLWTDESGSDSYVPSREIEPTDVSTKSKATVPHSHAYMKPTTLLTVSILQTTPIPTPSETNLQLHHIIHQPDLLPRPKSRQANIRTPIAPKRIAQRAIPTTAHLPLHREVDLGQVVSAQLQRGQGAVGGVPLRRVFGFDLLLQPARAVFAGAAALAGFGAAFGGCEG